MFVGWQIQSILRQQTELSKVPLDSIRRVCDRVETLIGQCLDSAKPHDPADPIALQRLRMLANEIEWLGTVVEALEMESAEFNELRENYWAFKSLLSGGKDNVELAEAADVGRAMRTACLQVQWKMSKRIVECPGDVGRIGGTGTAGRK